MPVPLSYIESVCENPRMNAEQLLRASAQALAKKSERDLRDAHAAGDRFALLAFLVGRARGPQTSSEPSRLTILLSAQMLLTQLLAEAVESAPLEEEAERKSHPEISEEAQQPPLSEQSPKDSSSSHRVTCPEPRSPASDCMGVGGDLLAASSAPASSSLDSQSSSSSSLLGVSKSAGFGEGVNMPAEFKRKLRALETAFRRIARLEDQLRALGAKLEQAMAHLDLLMGGAVRGD